MKNLLLSYILGLTMISFSCKSKSCQNLPNSFTNYQIATDIVKASSFNIEETFYDDSWISSCSYYSCDGKKGFLIIVMSGNEYIFRNIETHLWNRFKIADSKGDFYNTFIKRQSKYLLNLKYN